MFSHHASSGSVFSANSILRKLVKPSKVHDESVIEIIDNETEPGNIFLINALVTCVMPEEHGGCNYGVIYFDLNQHFDLLSLISMMEERTNADESKLKEWIRKFYIVRCDSVEQLIITLYSIEPLIANSKIPVKLLILDGLSTFHWNEQCAGGFSQYLKEQNYRKLVKALDLFHKKYNLSILVRTLEMFPPITAENADQEFDLRNLKLYGDFWENFVTYRFILKFKKSSTISKIDDFNRTDVVLSCFSPSHYDVSFSLKGSVVK
ncbi:DNA repair protein XRCC2-like [Styela clava]